MFNFRAGQAGASPSTSVSTPGGASPSPFQSNFQRVTLESKSSFADRKPFAPNVRPEMARQTTPDEVIAQVSAWDNEMDSLDKKQEQLLNDQWKLLRSQIGALMSALSEVQAEVQELKEHQVSKEVEDVVKNLLGAHEEHGEKHAGLIERVKYLEDFVGESADQHQKMIAAAHGNHEEHKTSMETRLEYIEAMIGDNADKHAQELNRQVEDMQKKLTQCAQGEHHATLETRVDFLEKYIGESVDVHDSHKTTLETRLEYIEAMIGDNADKHAGEIEKAKGRTGSLEAAIRKCAAHDHVSGMEKRVDYLEKCLGESADNHDNHKANMEQRLEYIEALVGDNADKHWKEIQAANGKLGDVHAALKQCAKAETHGEVEKRLGFLEAFIGESSAQIAREMAEAKEAGRQYESHQTMEVRIEFIEAMLGDSADKHKELDSQKGKLTELHDLIKQCAKHDHAKGIEQRLDFLEKCLGESADKHDDHKVNMEGRLKYIEDCIGDNADKHWKEIAAAKDKLGNMDDALKACATADDHGKIEKRLTYIESFVGESLNKHKREVMDQGGKHAKDLEAAHERIKDLVSRFTSEGSARDQRHGTIEEKLVNLERSYGDINDHLSRKVLSLEASSNSVVERHSKELEDAKTKIRETLAKVDTMQASYSNLRGTTEQRLESIESVMAESGGGKFSEFTKDLEKRLYYMQEDQKRARDVLESSLLEQVRLEHSIHEDQARQLKEVWEREAKTRIAYQEQYKDLLQQERSGRELMENNIQQRFHNMESNISTETQRIWVAIDKHTHEGLTQPAPPPPSIVEVVKQAPTIVETLPIVQETVVMPPVVQEVVQSPRVPLYNVAAAPTMVPPGAMSPAAAARRLLPGTMSRGSFGVSPRGQR